MAQQSTPQRQRPQERLFGKLIASKPPKERKSTATATAMSLVVHGVILGALVWATMAVGKEVKPALAQYNLIKVKDETPPPPPPPPPPPLKQTPPPKQVAETPRGFQTLEPPMIVPPTIPPPKAAPVVHEADFSGMGVAGGTANGTPTKVSAEDIEAAPTFTPYTVRPELKNRDRVARELQRIYPPMLRDAGIGGTVLIWVLIDEQGRVLKTRVKHGSGHEALDAAARKVGSVMRFTPALNRDQKVKVWIQLPVVFRAQ